MRTLYRPVWDGIQSSLRDIFTQGHPADKVIQRHMKINRKWGSHDRRMFAETVYDLVRWWRKLLFVSGQEWPQADRWETHSIEINARAIEAWCVVHEVQIDRAIEVRNVAASALSLWRDPSLPRAVAQSIPNWLDQLGAEQLGARWSELLPILNTPAPVFLRVNRLKCTAPQLIESLRAEGVEAEAMDGDCLRLKKRTNVFLTKSFAAGHFELQDAHSQRVAIEVMPEPGQRVIDACAGAGGKSLHLASLMNNRGKIIALDVVAKKLDQLRERSTRAGATCIEARTIESTKVVKRLKESADRLLLDVPCSGLGVLRRNPDSKWKLTPERVAELRRIQNNILATYAQMCKPAGIMVYATCSFLPSESAQQVEHFLSQNETAWELETQQTLWPEIHGADGFYLARMRRRRS